MPTDVLDKKALELQEKCAAYLGVKFDDIMFVRAGFGSQLDDINHCAQKIMQGNATYESCKGEVVAIMQEQVRFEGLALKRLERTLNLYAIIDKKRLPAPEHASPLLFNKRLKAVRSMQEIRMLDLRIQLR